MSNIPKKVMCRESIRIFELKFKCKELGTIRATLMYTTENNFNIAAVIVIEIYAHQ